MKMTLNKNKSGFWDGQISHLIQNKEDSRRIHGFPPKLEGNKVSQFWGIQPSLES